MSAAAWWFLLGGFGWAGWAAGITWAWFKQPSCRRCRKVA